MSNNPHAGEAAGGRALLPAESRLAPSPPSTPAEGRNDVFPDFTVSLEEANRRVKLLQQFVREHMVDGEDFGVIPGSNKPTLFKPGAEKLNAIFGFAPTVGLTHRVEDWEKGFVAYEVKISLINKRTGLVEAEGLGSCNSRERRYVRQDAPSIANTVLKIAKKRALIDATLSATCASGLFAQDLEDESSSSSPEARRTQPAEAVRDTAQVETNIQPGPAARERQPFSNFLTDAQHRAILAIAGRVFGRPATTEDFAQLTEKSLEELTKSEASALIDRLRYRLAETQAENQTAKNSATD